MNTLQRLQTSVLRWLGNTVGDIQIFPYPMFCVLWGDISYRVKGPELRKITGILNPGDILLRRYDRFISSLVIPGFYSHVGIYVGNHNVIHSLAPCVQSEDILTFARTDYLTVLRIPGITDADIERAVHAAKSALGKPYDYLFDGTESRQYYCTELIRDCWLHKLPELAGKKTLPPDVLTELGLTVVHNSEEWK